MSTRTNFTTRLTRWQICKALTVLVVIGGAVWLALVYFIPTPPSKVVMATAFKGASSHRDSAAIGRGESRRNHRQRNI
jgi:hypothetical protein